MAQITEATVYSQPCFEWPCMSDSEREAIAIYVLNEWLTALGGATSYATLDDLLTGAKAWDVYNMQQLKALMLKVAIEYAENAGATFADQTAAGLKDAAKCFLCLPADVRSYLIPFLLWQIFNAVDAARQ